MTDKHNNTEFEKRWRQRFRHYAKNYGDDAGIAGWSSTGLETRLRNFSRLLEQTNSSDFWLDAGCGAGSYSRLLQSIGCQVVGVDYSEESVIKAKERSDGQLNWMAANVKELPFTNESFDHAMCFGVLQALTESDLAVKELVGVVKPGGTIWVDALNYWCLPHLLHELKRFIRRKPPHLRYETARNIRNTFKKSNIKSVKVHWLPILPSRFIKYQWLLETAVIRFIVKYLPFVGMLLSHSVVVVGKR